MDALNNDDDVEDGGGVNGGGDVGLVPHDSFASDGGDSGCSSDEDPEGAGLVQRRNRKNGGGYSGLGTTSDGLLRRDDPGRSGGSCRRFSATALVLAAVALGGGAAGFWLGAGRQSQNQQPQQQHGGTGPDGASATAKALSVSSMDEKTFQELQHEAHILPRDKKSTVRYDPTAFLASGGGNSNSNSNNNPFGWDDNDAAAAITPPRMKFGTPGGGAPPSSGAGRDAYAHHPHLVNGRLAFVSEGDVYVTRIGGMDEEEASKLSPSSPLAAMRLTSTVGNAGEPRFHPTLPYVAYTATYSGRRDVYLMDLRPNSPSAGPMRLTYWDVGAGGVSGLVGWNVEEEADGDADGTRASLVFRALSNDVSMPDYRLYQVHLETGVLASATSATSPTAAVPPPAVWQVEPVPLAQATDGVRHGKCWYFVRTKQSSHTVRYVGGTAENLWRYCDGHPSSDPLLPDGYRGTTKDPQLLLLPSQQQPPQQQQAFLFFLSDRGRTGGGDEGGEQWIPDRMNVWAMRLAEGEDGTLSALVQITDAACDFEGRTVQEYTVDATTGDLVVRIGADLYLMDGTAVKGRLASLPVPVPGRGNGDIRDRRRRHLDGEQQPDHNTETSEEEHGEDGGPDGGGNARDAVTGGEAEPNGEDASDQSQEQSSQAAAADDAEVVAGNGTDGSTASETPSDVSPAPEDKATDEEPERSDPAKGTAIASDSTETASPTGFVVGAESFAGSDDVTDGNNTDPGAARYFYDYRPPELVPRKEADAEDHITGRSSELVRLPISVYSDFSSQQERLLPVSMVKHYQYGDVFETVTQSTQMLVTLRGQLWVAPVVQDALPPYKEAGKNMPARQYRLAPGAMMGGVTRILAAMHVPNPVEDDISDRRLAVVLATDPLTPTAEHAFYLVETQPGAAPLFVDPERLPKPFLGGIVSGGSTRDGGLGSVKPETLAMSPCGNRMAWSDTDGRIVAMTMPQYQDLTETADRPTYTVLPQKNELGEPMVGDEVVLVFSPGGRYLAVEHNARNQFRIISIVDLGDPLAAENRVAEIDVGRIVQATPARFNSGNSYWGQSPTDIHDLAREQKLAQLFGLKEPDDHSSALYFLSDRDITTDVSSPWGYRQQMPHFVDKKALFALPLTNANDAESDRRGQFPGGGVEELQVEKVLERKNLMQSLLSKSTTSSSRRNKRKLAEAIHPLAGAFGFAEKSFRENRYHEKGTEARRLEGGDGGVDGNVGNDELDSSYFKEAVFPKDMDIGFGPVDLSFARQAYRVANIPEGNYRDILCQVPGDGSLVLIEDTGGEDGSVLTMFMPDTFPSDQYVSKTFKATARQLGAWKLSSSRQHFILIFLPDGATRIVPNSLGGISQLFGDADLDYNVVDRSGLHISVWPSLEYLQMYNDAWRMLRDYYYDPEMTGIDWPAIHERYLPLVGRCRKREELDDVLIQMASELSALHVFVYGGEYDSPMHNDASLEYANKVGSLGASLRRNPAWNGYTVTSIPQADPDFTMIDQSTPIHSPLSEQSLRLSGQRGLQVGDVIVGVNGESVMSVPDIHMLLRGTSGKSVRLDVLRLSSGTEKNKDVGEGDGSNKNGDRATDEATVESIVAVPLDPEAAGDLLYHAWEWKTERLAQELASEAGISVGYVHMQDMSGEKAEDAFARGFFPNYQKQGFILDVRHNRGGNIDAWVLDVLQRKPWMYWQSRDFDPTNGGLGWNEHFAFRGHIVVLLDEKTSSDGEGVSRGIAELGLGRLIGTRTWGGGIWLASDNNLVDGGIATAPEIGTYNGHIGWGLGIEQSGVDPDIVVDNDPHETFTGTDRQLERAIEELKKWIEEEPVVLPRPPEKKKDMTMGDRECKA